ncbi:MAG TPA: hypothetical protein VF384_03135 [Planctomycetota bacterium]
MSDQPESAHPNPSAPPNASARPPYRPGRGRHARAERARKTRNAGRWVLVIAIIQLLFGIWFGWKHGDEADAALRHLSTMEADEVVELENGEKTTVADLRAAVERERLQVFVIPIGLGVVFFGLYFWARSSPVPALTTALGLFVAVHALEAVVEPASIVRGIVVKIFCVAGLASGVRSALLQRALDREDEDEQESATGSPA